jgi:hypothetical protein
MNVERACFSRCIFAISQLVQKQRVFKLPTYLAFVDYEKLFDEVVTK